METIKVNMSPNPLDVQTIHASQNDGEARQWKFELHNNGELIDTSEITEQLFFKAYKGGTEQLLPENGSTPTTSPFLGDIRYPQGLLSDQEFTYRQSPTEEDGLAKITDIKGNTLVWNQLVQNGNFAENVAWNGFGGTYSYADNVGTLTVTSASATQGISAVRTRVQAPANHILLLKFDIKSDNANALFGVSLNTNSLNTNNVFSSKHASTSWETWSAIITPTVNVEGMRIATYTDGLLNVGEKFYLRNVNLIDLTAMFGSGNEPTSVSDFTSLFPLSYYSYNQGSLLSFNGNGIKTVGRNILDLSSEFNRLGVNYTIDDDGWYTVSNVSNPNLYISRLLLPKKLTNGSVRIVVNNAETTVQNFAVRLFNGTTVVAQTQDYFENEEFDRLCFNWSSSGSQASFKLMVVDSPTIGSYEPYTSSTLSLPTQQYFPNGMKSAGSVYDELTESKAITRVGSRAYQSGDESDTSVITDGTTTYYALVNPTETSFTTASLVTENAEITLSNEDGTLIGKCTEQLSENPGFIDAKIKLADSDGECYSNKLQLHVERSPQ